jgi:hypothetical protein
VAELEVTWDPPVQARIERLTSDGCPECGAAMIASPQATLRLCNPCGALRPPPGVLAPYARGSEVTRAARSQRERDDDAKRTVLQAGEFLRSVAELLADPKIHAASGDLLRWYQEEVTDARNKRDGRRLAELADEFADDHAAHAFRRAHWWQGEPAALPAAAVDEGDDEDQDYDEDYDEDQDYDEVRDLEHAAPASRAAPSQPMMWAEALAVCGWRIAVSSISGGNQMCQVIDEHGQQCRMPAVHGIQYDALGRHAWLCPGHHDPLGGLIIETNQARGIS